jgi:hypothetical protein
MSLDPRRSRGWRNRNPGNIEHNPANKWQGLDDPPSDGRFCRFRSHAFGIRALAVLLITYQDRHGLRTIEGIIRRWAPATENDTLAYMAAVARRMGRGLRDTLDLHRHADLRPLVEAIIAHELGGQPYDDATLDEGLRLAGVVPDQPAGVMHTGTARAAAGTAAAGAAAVAVVQPLAEAAAQAAPALAALRELSPLVAVALILAVAGWFIWQRARRGA